MAESSGPPGPHPSGRPGGRSKFYRIVEVSPEELERMKLGPDEVEDPNLPRGHIDVDGAGYHDHHHGGTDHDHDSSFGDHHVHPM